MATETEIAKCSRCGATAPREDMFGLEPELLCEACSTGVRKRLAPKPVGRLVNTLAGRPTPVTSFLVGLSMALFFAEFLIYGHLPDRYPPWLLALQPWEAQPHSILSGDWWRLVTSAVLHGGILHVILNLTATWALARPVEGSRGSIAFALLFLGSAAFSSAAQTYFFGPFGVGLSGALFAFAGYLWMRRREDAVAREIMSPSVVRMLGLVLVLGIVFPGWRLANGAHAGGLVWGLMAGWISTQPKPGRYAGYVVLAIWTVLAAWYVSSGHTLWPLLRNP